MIRGGPLGGRPCKKRAMVYNPRLQFTFFTRLFGLGFKAGIRSFFAQKALNSLVTTRVSLGAILGAYHNQAIPLRVNCKHKLNLKINHSVYFKQTLTISCSYERNGDLQDHSQIWHKQSIKTKPSSVGAPKK